MTLDKIQQHLKNTCQQEQPLWNPSFCGDIDIEIKKNGSWFYMGSLIQRLPLVKLFASVLRKEDDDYFLVTPVEKLRIQVEEAPFVIQLLTVKNENNLQILSFTDNLEREWIASQSHPIIVLTNEKTRTPRPYLLLYNGLHALIHRNVFYQLVELAEEKTTQQGIEALVRSQDHSFSLGRLD